MNRHQRTRLLIVLLSLLTIYAGSGQAAAAGNERIELGIKPVGVSGSYFELTAEPGETQQLTVEIGNYSERDAAARFYPADVYSLVNGGMGVGLADAPTGETTGWLGIDAETIELAAGEAVLRSFAVRVPADAQPGEYITSVVIQDATAIADAAEGEMVTKRVNRQAIAVAVTVPGPVTPGFALGAVEHHIAGGRSVVTVEVRNEGNVRLQPAGELTLGSGSDRATFPIRMDSVYAGTTTVAEVAFSTVLEPGAYSASLTLSDERHDVRATTSEMPIAIGESTAPTTAATVTSASTVVPPAATSSGRQSPLPSGITVMAAIVVAIVGGLAVGRKLARRERVVPTAPTAPTSVQARPVAVRQLAVPNRSATTTSTTIPTGETASFKRLGNHQPLTTSQNGATNAHA